MNVTAMNDGMIQNGHLRNTEYLVGRKDVYTDFKRILYTLCRGERL